ncbi:hypothetical protein [Nocardia iowensis]|uniref:Uncharacterized protein n=1 Tax=Nocardia iowensis TaxID=204891 RepID=A0ABX8RGT8_NOCIO|nr:hypothetical protein [Nocardia iowensis]QXN88818.1 hypothetical protein KV110_24910 [Nocardia iowensis]
MRSPNTSDTGDLIGNGVPGSVVALVKQDTQIITGAYKRLARRTTTRSPQRSSTTPAR